MPLTPKEQDRRDRFIQWVEASLTVAKFKAMLAALDFQNYSWTKVTNGNKDLNREQLETVATHLNVEPGYLVTEYGLGRHRIPAAQLDQITGKTIAA